MGKKISEFAVIGAEVVLRNGCEVMPFAVISGRSVIGSNTVIGSFCEIIDSEVGQECEIISSTIKNSSMGNRCKVQGRSSVNGSKIGAKCIADSLQIINSSVGNDCKFCNTTVENTEIGENCSINGSQIVGSTLKSCCEIGVFSVIINSEIGERCTVASSHVLDSAVGGRATVGPYAHLRNNSVLGEGCRVGNFTEIKKSRLMKGVKAAHLAYIGDAEVGENSNIGCGAVFVNYDGKNKHKTTVGNNCFIGSSVNLIAPLNIGDNSFIACGTTITSDLPPDAFAVGRSEPYVRKRKNNACTKGTDTVLDTERHS